jgi:fructokinase
VTDSATVSPTIVCFGEALWDILPRGIFLGGAPLNVAYHLSRLGAQALPVSAVGRDFLGDEALRRVEAWGIRTEFIARVRRKPTGVVRANLDTAGVARFEIAQRVAWDRIKVPRELRRMPAPRAIVYGSLALRGNANRVAAMDLLTRWPDTLRVLDLNLRPPFDRGAGVRFALGHAQLLKLNDTELARVTAKPVGSVNQLQAAAREFAQSHGIARVCVTAGARGAGLLWGGEWSWEPGRPVVVRDTVGAGDAFLAGFLAGHLHRQEMPRDALKSACRLGEFVAARDGATPPYHCNSRGLPTEAGSPA